uniref:Plant natriuretic peptide-like 2 n=1 Tax=Venturia pyrina TaxID=415593 RepID=A0A513ZS97_9PEZI|nr:plant natriuretic peptide-like 2 [Venturia pyrina]
MKAPTALIAISYFAYLGLCDSGTGATYPPPYRPNKCYGNREDIFPGTNLFAAAGQGIWDNGGACGRIYEILCNSPVEGSDGKCTGQTVRVRIVEGKLGYRAATLTLSQTAGAVVYTGKGRFNIQYHRL